MTPPNAAANALGPRLRLSVLTPVYNERHVVEASLRRVLALEDELIASLELIVVDDRSTDGSWEVLERVAASDPRVVLLRHETNQGKGAAIRTALARATGDVTVIHDADLEYDPTDIPKLLVPFVKEGADAVYGSRYIAAPYRRTLLYRHTLINKTITQLCNWVTDLDLTDVETCYKAIRTPLFQSIPLRSRDFRIEIELTSKLAKRRARIFEVPIRYLPRTFEEGKKIRARDGALALAAMARFALIDDLYQPDDYGTHMLADLQHARRFQSWVADRLRPFMGDRVLELGAGVASLSSQLIPRDRYVAAETNPHHLHYLRSWALGKPYVEVLRVDPSEPADFDPLAGQFDTVLMLNLLERQPDPVVALQNAARALRPGGQLVVLAPQNPDLYGPLDQGRRNRVRFARPDLERLFTEAGLTPLAFEDFARAWLPAWWANSHLLRRKTLSRLQLKASELLTPALERLDDVLPWPGLDLLAVARRS